jgi:hypothetical protein
MDEKKLQAKADDLFQKMEAGLLKENEARGFRMSSSEIRSWLESSPEYPDYPHHCRLPLRVGIPDGSDTGLPCSTYMTRMG